MQENMALRAVKLREELRRGKASYALMVLRDPRVCRALLAPCTTFRRIVWTSADNITVVVQLVQLVAQPGIRQELVIYMLAT
ncbi:unnamed protein product [Strongylus vulgaris]|uniref:Uncharacterized protein n=1 Tax=Strongylus vulgaris TaxID=40348 RepID=A0A3P7LPM3_STRVU|nr:unnamed protein product [Strongylus vulgaris]